MNNKSKKRVGIPVGSKIKFESEKQRYTVRASSKRFAVCTKPMNARKTVIYSIVDFEDDVRGTDNLVFGFWNGYESKKACQKALKDLESGEMSVSHRNRIKLNIERIDHAQ